MRYRVKHRTSYLAREPVSVGHNQAWLRPRNLPWQSVESSHLKIKPTPSKLTERVDAFGNSVTTFSFNEGYSRLVVEAQSQVFVEPAQLPLESCRSASQIHDDLFAHATAEDLDALQFLFASPLVPTIEAAQAFARESFDAELPLAESAYELMHRVYEAFQFDPHVTTVSTPVEQVLAERRGVCQDFAHALLAMFRSVGVAARYVSGYLRTYPPPGKPRLVGADASHAWVAVYCGREVGWYDLDPTNDKHPTDEHITVAWGRDYADIPPLRGVFLGGGNPTLQVSVDVEPLDEVAART